MPTSRTSDPPGPAAIDVAVRRPVVSFSPAPPAVVTFATYDVRSSSITTRMLSESGAHRIDPAAARSSAGVSNLAVPPEAGTTASFDWTYAEYFGSSF